MKTTKKFFSLLWITYLLVACNSPVDNYPEPIVGSYAYGADCSWITEQEHDGVLFYDSIGQVSDGMRVMRDVGMNAVRLRVWVNHSTGWCNKEDVITKAKRAAALKLRMIFTIQTSSQILVDKIFLSTGKTMILNI